MYRKKRFCLQGDSATSFVADLFFPLWRVDSKTARFAAEFADACGRKLYPKRKRCGFKNIGIRGLNRQLICYSPQKAASTLKSPHYCTTLEKSKRTSMEMTSFAPGEVFRVPRYRDTGEVDFPFITRFELRRSVQRSNMLSTITQTKGFTKDT